MGQAHMMRLTPKISNLKVLQSLSRRFVLLARPGESLGAETNILAWLVISEYYELQLNLLHFVERQKYFKLDKAPFWLIDFFLEIIIICC